MNNEQRHPIIRSTKELPVLVRFINLVLTLLVWALYVYFMRDTFAFARDFTSWAGHGFSTASDYPTFKVTRTILFYLMWVVITAMIFASWSLYNLLRYGKKTRRGRRPPVLPEHLAEMYNRTPREITMWQNTRHMVMHHDKSGLLMTVEKV